MNATSLLLLLPGLAVLTACSSAENSIEVDIHTAPDASGVVVLCGREAPLVKRGHLLQASISISCEGSGEARLRLENGDRVTCPIGYVTYAIKQHFSYVLEGAACRELQSDNDS